MSIFKAMAKVENYLVHCPSNKTKLEARTDFIQGIEEIKSKGYTWGRTHQIPFDYKSLSHEDLNKIINFLKKK